jgi:hypothetical protein
MPNSAVTMPKRAVTMLRNTQTYVLTIVHECKEFNAWKAGFDADQSNRIAAGLTDIGLVRLATSPNVVGLAFEVRSVAEAKAMVGSPQLREAMHKAGVVGAPDVHFRQGELAWVPSAHYLTFNMRISGMERFKAAFAMDKAERLAATITDIAVLQALEDPDDVLLIAAIGDLPTAQRFLASPELAAHIEKNTGIVDEPLLRFWTA